MSPLSQGDRRLAGRAGRGDDAAFAQLAARHRERLVRAARRRLGDRRADAEDVVQEALVRALRALRAGKRPENPAAWLLAIVGNCCNDHHQAAARRVVVPLLEDADGGAATEALDPHRVAEGRERVAGAVAAVRALPESQRAALVGFELGGQTYEELAAEHGWSVPATKSLLWRARTSLAAERERWVAAVGWPLVGVAHAVRSGLAGLADKPAALLGAHHAGDLASFAAVAVLAAGAAGGGPGMGGGETTERERATGGGDAVEASARAVRSLPAAAPGTGGPARAAVAPASGPGEGAQTAEAVLRACARGQSLAGAAPDALAAARRSVPSDLEQYTDCAARIARALAAG